MGLATGSLIPAGRVLYSHVYAGVRVSSHGCFNRAFGPSGGPYRDRNIRAGARANRYHDPSTDSHGSTYAHTNTVAYSHADTYALSNPVTDSGTYRDTWMGAVGVHSVPD